MGKYYCEAYRISWLCWGVECAVGIAYEVRKQFPNDKIWITNEIIHNPTVNKLQLPIYHTNLEKNVFYSEVVEHANGMTSLQMGEFGSDVSHGIDTYNIREAIGVCARIYPFNFPTMIPLWMFPVVVTFGNTFVLKPLEKDPGASIMLAELAMKSGLPNGALNIVHGTNEIVNAICDDENIKAISFVGSNTVAEFFRSRSFTWFASGCHCELHR
ncbi:unnamed protein product [Lactuca saligna]|uniref:4-hydroxy-3-methylbut-2-enyl diphosphate reductase n=1 Tax=Lactuca saligna TaxID=75948 RepID=A0AA35VIP9_LACSI|nr:unnamed protein product [Lactuca saligna]